MKDLILTICLSFLFISCKKDKLEGDKEIFIGKWEWVHTVHKFNFCDGYPNSEETITPDTDGSAYSVEFLKKGIVKYYENGNYLDKDRIVFGYYENGGCSDSNYSTFFINLNNDSENSINSFDGCVSTDTLILIRGFPYKNYVKGCETFKSYFVKQ